MNQRLAIALASALSLTAVACSQSQPPAASESSQAPAAEATVQNPFFAPSTLPFQSPPFDKIHTEDYVPAFEKGMTEQLAEIDAIANSSEPATFENTVVAMERSGQLLNRVQTVFFSLTGANTNDAMEKIQSDMAPKLSAHQDAIALNGKLFARVQSLYDQRDSLGLDPESHYLLERYYTDFVRAGAKLSDADKTKLTAFNAELASLQTTFSQNVLKETNASAIVVDPREELAGLSDNAIAAAAQAAKDAGKEGKFVLAMMNTSGDLQEPLRKINSFAELLAHDYRQQLDEMADKYIDYITDGATRMQALIEDLLIYSRVGRQELNKQPTDLNTVVSQVIIDLSFAIAENNAIITTTPLPTLPANPVQMAQLFQTRSWN